MIEIVHKTSYILTAIGLLTLLSVFVVNQLSLVFE